MAQLGDWYVLGACMRGASHIRSGTVCQDSIHWLPEHGKGPPIMLSVADGHGSSKYYRSGIGAGFAAYAAEATFCQLLSNIRAGHFTGINQIKKYIEGEIERNIKKNWLQMVEMYSRNAPIYSSEKNNVSALETGQKSLVENYIPYGATLLSVLVHDQFIAYVQLGDGDIVTISQLGEPRHVFLTRMLGVETNSLSETEVVWFDKAGEFESTINEENNEDGFAIKQDRNDFHVDVQIMEEPDDAPAFICLSTDGLSNSYLDDEDFFEFGLDIFRKFKENGFDQAYRSTSESLPCWLHKVSTDGSGDDTTLGILVRPNAFRLENT